MNNWNRGESQLRSWTPRPPSARLRETLFAAAPPTAELRAARVANRSHGLAPALVCLMLMGVVFNLRQSEMAYLTATPDSHVLVPLFTNRIPAAYLAAAFHSGRNGPLSDTLEWTNGARLTSNLRPLPAPATNSLPH